jgi:hypothetical protein
MMSAEIRTMLSSLEMKPGLLQVVTPVNGLILLGNNKNILT